MYLYVEHTVYKISLSKGKHERDDVPPFHTCMYTLLPTSHHVFPCISLCTNISPEHA
ncbi:hypothetical protein CSUI_008963, partial [Cystoisospora suis]